MPRIRPARAQNKPLSPPDFHPFKRSPKLGPALTRETVNIETKRYKCRRPKVGEAVTRRLWDAKQKKFRTVVQKFTTPESIKYVQLCAYQSKSPRTGKVTDKIKIIRTKANRKKVYNEQYWKHLVALRDEKGTPKFPNRDRRGEKPVFEAPVAPQKGKGRTRRPDPSQMTFF
jgi:hypothetical protein